MDGKVKEGSVEGLSNLLVSGFAELEETVESHWIFGTLDKPFALKRLQIPKAFGVAYQFDVLPAEEIAEVADVLYKFLVIEVASDVECPQILDICQHLNKLHILDELFIKLIVLFNIDSRF